MKLILFSGISMKDDQLIEMVQNSLQPQIERRLAAKKRLDDLAVSTLIATVNNAIEEKYQSKPSTSEEKLVKDLKKDE